MLIHKHFRVFLLTFDSLLLCKFICPSFQVDKSTLFLTDVYFDFIVLTKEEVQQLVNRYIPVSGSGDVSESGGVRGSGSVNGSGIVGGSVSGSNVLGASVFMVISAGWIHMVSC